MAKYVDAFVCLLAGMATSCLIGCAVQTEKGSVRVDKEEQAIRRYFEHWMKATREGDLESAKSLIADDAVFLVPGADRMDKESFAAAATASDPNTDFQLDCSIQEIEVFGDHAWLWTKMSLTMTDKRSKTSSTMAGHSLSILKRQGDGWVVIRDANTTVGSGSQGGQGGMKSQPSSGCSLTSVEKEEATSEFLEAFRRYHGTARMEGTDLVVCLYGAKPEIATFLDGVIERETRCCSFLRFSLEELENGYSVSVRGESPAAVDTIQAIRETLTAEETGGVEK